MDDHLRFFLDEHIPAAVAQGLHSRGVEVLTVQQAGRSGLGDRSQIEFALASGQVIVTFDDDFLSLAATGIRHAGIAFGRAEHCSIGGLIHALLLLHDVLTPEDMMNHIEFL